MKKNASVCGFKTRDSREKGLKKKGDFNEIYKEFITDKASKVK